MLDGELGLIVKTIAYETKLMVGGAVRRAIAYEIAR